MIDVRNAGKRFGDRWIFRDLSFQIGDGEIVAILGRNGTGKTTLLRAVLGLDALSEGEVDVRREAALVPQNSDSPFAYSVLDIVLMGRARHLGMFQLPKADDYVAARDALAILGIEAFEARLISELSGGERQLVLIARAIASGARILVLDEPTSALDFNNQDTILNTMRWAARNREMTVLFTSHYPQHALHIADKALLMFGVEDHSFGDASTVLSENALSRLYDFPIVHLSNAEGVSTLTPVFTQRAGELSGQKDTAE